MYFREAIGYMPTCSKATRQTKFTMVSKPQNPKRTQNDYSDAALWGNIETPGEKTVFYYERKGLGLSMWG